MPTKDREFGRFTVLLCALLSFICALPFVSESGFGVVALRYGTPLLLISAVYSVSERRWPLVLAIVLASPAVIAHVLPTLIGAGETLLFRMVVSAIFLSYITILLSSFLLRQERVSADMILGAMNVYLLSAIIFMFLHAIAEIARPGSYVYQGDSLTASLGGHTESHMIVTLLYFSLVTLTTLGYGDISPAVPIARTLCSLEAVIGQFFVAVFIARMVAIHIGQRQ